MLCSDSSQSELEDGDGNTLTGAGWLLQGNIFSQQQVLCIYSGNAGRTPHCARASRQIQATIYLLTDVMF